jgi:hypothetical protein
MHRLLYGLTPAQARELGEEASRIEMQARLPEGVIGQVLAGGLFIFH